MSQPYFRSAAEAVVAVDRTRRAADSSDFVVRIMTTVLVLTIVTQKIAIPIQGDRQQIELPLVIVCIALAVLLAKGLLRIHPLRFALYLCCIGAAAFGHTVNQHAEFSFPAILMFIVIYGMLIFIIPVPWRAYRRVLNNFTTLGLAAAGLVMLGWAMQLVGLGMLNLEALTPQSFVFQTYVYTQPLHWGSPFTKPNGLFFLETSSVSQFIAMALVIEASFFRRAGRLAALGFGVLATFGGTGFLLLLLSAPLFLARLKPKMVIAAVVAAPLVLGASYKLGLLDNIAHRSTEYSEEGSSANQRFVAPFAAVADALGGNSMDALFGIGAGNMPRKLHVMWNPVSKAVSEYGVMFAVFWFAFVISAMFGSGVPFAVSWIMFVQYHLLNGSFAVPLNVIYPFLLASAYSVRWPKPLGGRLGPAPKRRDGVLEGANRPGDPAPAELLDWSGSPRLRTD